MSPRVTQGISVSAIRNNSLTVECLCIANRFTDYPMPLILRKQHCRARDQSPILFGHPASNQLLTADLANSSWSSVKGAPSEFFSPNLLATSA